MIKKILFLVLTTAALAHYAQAEGGGACEQEEQGQEDLKKSEVMSRFSRIALTDEEDENA